MENSFIYQTLIKIGVSEKLLKNPIVYKLLENKLIDLMRIYDSYVLSENSRNSDAVQSVNEFKTEQFRISWFEQLGKTHKEADEMVLVQKFEFMDVDQYNQFLSFVTGKMKVDTYSKYSHSIVMKVKNGKVYIKERLPDEDDDYVISQKPNSQNTVIGKRTLSSVQDFATGEMLKDYFMGVEIMAYNENGKKVYGERTLYKTENEIPIKKEITDPRTGRITELKAEDIIESMYPISNGEDVISFKKALKKLRKAEKKKEREREKYTGLFHGSSAVKRIIVSSRNKKMALKQIENPDIDDMDL